MNWHKLRVGQVEAPTVRLVRKVSQRSKDFWRSGNKPVLPQDLSEDLMEIPFSAPRMCNITYVFPLPLR